jgi:hypothetical protein
VDEVTENIYATTAGGGMGSGKGAGKGGWPGGMENAKVRFLRLEYAGGEWDNNMGMNADFNLLIQLHKITTLNIADSTEHVTISELKHFPPGKAPPFVYLTGRGAIQVSSQEVKILRWYCLEEGGMIFADHGGGFFDEGFRNLMARVFPPDVGASPLVDIPSDDDIYRIPFIFPNGAPPLWHHTGTRALGIKYNGRWVVFYHPGDIGDAWKEGHSGASDQIAAEAFKMGINVINYAFTQYVNLHYKP